MIGDYIKKPTVFVGSSSEQSTTADHICVQLADVGEVTHWKDAFRPGITIFENLMEIRDNFDFAVLLLTPDDFLVSRDQDHIVPRDNVIFELGLFLGSLGPGRVFAVMDERIKTKLPSDYAGVVYVTYNGNRVDSQISRALRPACVRISEEIRNADPRMTAKRPTESRMLSEIGIERIYQSYLDAEAEILTEFNETSGPIRLLLYVASRNVGVKGPLLEVIESAAKRGVEVRILHSDLQSPIFERERLCHMGKDADRIRNTLSYVSDVLDALAETDGLAISRRSHDLPFIWRIYAFPSCLFIMPYCAEKDATVVSPVIKFSNKPVSLYKSVIDIFDYLWRSFSPKKLKIGDLVTSATPCGTALIVNWEGRHVFAIPRRDVGTQHGFVRFYGIGGKRNDQNESLVECALREGNEESGNAIQALTTSSTTQFVTYHGKIETIEITDEAIVPRLVIEKRLHSGSSSAEALDRFYYTFCYYANLRSKPKPSREIAALLFLDDEHLQLFKKTTHVTIGDLRHAGVEISIATDLQLSDDISLMPHGTAVYLINK